MGEIERILEWAFGTGGSSVHINVAQMSLRAAVVYGATVLIVRMGKKRFMSQATAFDVILGIMLGSMVSRAIAGAAPFVPTLAASAALVVVHWLFSAAAARWHAFGKTITEVPAATHRTIRPRRSRDNGAVIVSSIDHVILPHVTLRGARETGHLLRTTMVRWPRARGAALVLVLIFVLVGAALSGAHRRLPKAVHLVGP